MVENGGSHVYHALGEGEMFAAAANAFDQVLEAIEIVHVRPHRAVCFIALDNDQQLTLINAGEVYELLDLLRIVAEMAMEAVQKDDEDEV